MPTLDPKRINFQVKTFSFNKKKTFEDPRVENKHQNCALDPEDQAFKSKLRLSRRKSSLWRRRTSKRTLYLFFCNKYWRLYPSSLNSIQISFVSHFCDNKFWHAQWDISTSHIFFQKSRLPSPNKHLLQSSHDHKKCCLSSFEEEYRISLVKILSRWHRAWQLSPWNGDEK